MNRPLPYPQTFLQTLVSLVLCAIMASLTGCHYYEDYRVKKSTADLNEERAELLRSYRLCLEKYQDQPPKAKEICSVYTQQLREIDITRH